MVGSFCAEELELLQGVMGTGDQIEVLGRLVSRVATLEAAAGESEAQRRSLHNQLVELRVNVRPPWQLLGAAVIGHCQHPLLACSLARIVAELLSVSLVVTAEHKVVDATDASALLLCSWLLILQFADSATSSAVCCCSTCPQTYLEICMVLLLLLAGAAGSAFSSSLTIVCVVWMQIRVFCRVRPGPASAMVCLPDGVSVKLDRQAEGLKDAALAFDKVFGPSSCQAEVFGEVSDLVQSALDGYKVRLTPCAVPCPLSTCWLSSEAQAYALA